MTGNIESDIIFEVKDVKVVTLLIINYKVILIVVDYVLYLRNISHSTSFVFSETNFLNYQYNK